MCSRKLCRLLQQYGDRLHALDAQLDNITLLEHSESTEGESRESRENPVPLDAQLDNITLLEHSESTEGESRESRENPVPSQSTDLDYRYHDFQKLTGTSLSKHILMIKIFIKMRSVFPET